MGPCGLIYVLSLAMTLDICIDIDIDININRIAKIHKFYD